MQTQTTFLDSTHPPSIQNSLDESSFTPLASHKSAYVFQFDCPQDKLDEMLPEEAQMQLMFDIHDTFSESKAEGADKTIRWALGNIHGSSLEV